MLARFKRLSAVAVVSTVMFIVLLVVNSVWLATVRVNSSARFFFASFLIVPCLLVALALSQCLAPAKDPGKGASAAVVAATWFGIVCLLFIFGFG